MTGDGEEPHMSRIGRAVLGLLVAAAGIAGPAGAARAAAAAACDVAYRGSAFTGGYTAAITIRNIGDETIDGWTFSFPLGAGTTVVEFWNADLLTASSIVSARDKGWNAKVPPGGSIDVGFRAAGPSGGEPSWFSVNGIRCQ
jgi:hypothetical protein